MTPDHAAQLFTNREHLHSHIRTAPLAERIEARRHVRNTIAAATKKRDAAIADAEVTLAPLKEATAAAHHAFVAASGPGNEDAWRAARRAHQAAEDAELPGKRQIDAATSEFSTTAGVLELRLAEYPDPAADAALNQEAAAA